MKTIIWFGAALAILGVLGLAIPAFTTSQTKDVASIGSLKVQTDEQTTHVVPHALSLGALAIGVILIAAGAFARR
jgi:hypothetical protein